MARWPKVSPEVLEDVSQNDQVKELVVRMVDATREYIVQWDEELTDIADMAEQNDAINAIIKMADSVQTVSEALQLLRIDSIEVQQQNIAEFMQESEDAFQDMKAKAEEQG